MAGNGARSSPFTWEKRFVALLLCCLLVPAAVSWAQSPDGAGSAWNARMAALEEERLTQTGVAASIVFDDSGSMNERDKLGMAKSAFRSWIEGAPPDYRFGLTALNAGRLTALRRGNKAEVLAAVNRLRANGGTPLADTIARVAADIRRRRAAGALYERQVLVVLTDGEDTSARGVRGVQEELDRLRRENVEVVAFGYQGEGDYLRGAATRFFSPENAADIRRGLDAISAEVGDPADLVVDDATRQGMQRVAAPAPALASALVTGGGPAETASPTSAPVATSTPTPAATPPHQPPVASASTPTSTRQSSGGTRFPTLLVCVLLFFVLRAVIRRSTNRR